MNEKQEKLVIIIPAYNEEDNIDVVVQEWYEVVVKTGLKSRLMIIDDGSKDNTYEKLVLLQKKCLNYKRLLSRTVDMVRLSCMDINELWKKGLITYFKQIAMAKHFRLNFGSFGKNVKNMIFK
ncbi:glycosyltransferase involved in cell wall biosynthesis [Lachnospiraceae bacterium PF1-22]|uniref:glycosyltransferase n=1 Tax=Ohessyouella blattaphilus TaxID=2949333 RepID=UPI003E2217DA